ncbi:MAG: hypothetical protein IKL25_00695 [Clostridia bacterium]|nr:hypothetical protein [Clostridia bacterium]
MSSEKNLHNRPVTDMRYVNEEENDELEIDLVELMYRMLEKIKWIIGAALVGMLVSGIFTKFFVTPVYEATAKLYVQEAKDKVVDLSAINLSTQLAADYVQVFNNWHVHHAVITELGLPYSYREIQRMLTINTPEKTRIIEITVTSTDPQEAYDIAMAYAKHAPIFIEARMETSRPNIFEEPRVPTRPSAPNMTINVFIGTFLGAAIAVAVIFIQFVSDDRVRNAEMLQKRLGLATLGMMPLQEGGNDSKLPGKDVKKHAKGGKK